MGFPKLIDNERHSLEDVLKTIIDSRQYEDLSIATGYWDLPGMVNIIEGLASFKSIRLLIGQEPLSGRLQRSLNFNESDPEELFPDKDFAFDLERAGHELNEETTRLRGVVRGLQRLMETGVLQVKVFRHPRLHAKAYIFGRMDSPNAVGIIGSSNFTKAGLSSNAELNYLENDPRRVLFQPQTIEQENGHLSWFNNLWDDPEAVEWTGSFSKVLGCSPVGDRTFGPYDVYIRTLMEVFPDELAPIERISDEVGDVLYSFQNRNAGILLHKLKKMGVAMLSDSVGLGKTITAGAVIKQYRDMGAHRIVVIAPASLERQWKDDLGARFELSEHDFTVVSMQNMSQQQELIDEMRKPWIREVDLFVIDEAHNLRNPASSRYQSVLQLLDSSPKAPVLLLTATPINNSLMDFANQIQLGLRGKMTSIPVQYKNAVGELEIIDFLEALKRIQGEAKKAEKAGEPFDWARYSSTLRSGLRHYLVRSTRQGVEAEGGLSKGGMQRHFPRTVVNQLPYRYDQGMIDRIRNECDAAIEEVFEGLDPLCLNLDLASKVTQQTMHPLDLYSPVFDHQAPPFCLDALSEEEVSGLFKSTRSNTLIPSVFQVINLLGFAPYRPDIYRHRFYGKSGEQIADMALKGEEKSRISVQRTIHNILHVTWLKRLESSSFTLLRSVDYYAKRLDLFRKYLDKGFVVSLGDIFDLESEYGEDLERAFTDYERSIQAIQNALDRGEDVSDIKLKGVPRVEASERDFDLKSLRRDLARDENIVALLQSLLKIMCKPEANGKLIAFAGKLKELVTAGKHGNKVLIFSFFSDTIRYLQESLPALMRDVPDFEQRCAFVSGAGGNAEDVARRFAPKAKKYLLKPGEQEIDYLFATDVLSEGQNLQDAAILVNYDLHWNPVRMIQRNGRINRLGSTFSEVLVVNMKPHEDLELYLNLVRRLERKIDAIKNSIGTDQSVLGEEAHPIEYADDFYSDDVEKASAAAQRATESSSALDVFDSSDEYIFELRAFLKEHRDDADMKRILSIPFGKWNYLPRSQGSLDSSIANPSSIGAVPDRFLCLERVEGCGVTTGEPFDTTLFVGVKTTGRYVATPLEEVTALSRIRTTPDDNEPMRDNIPTFIDRGKVAKRANSMARVQAESTELRELKPSEQRALSIMQAYCDQNLDILGVVRKGIHSAQDNREFKRIVKMVNSEERENGVVSASTQNRFAALIKHLESLVGEERRADTVKDVLFYASQL